MEVLFFLTIIIIIKLDLPSATISLSIIKVKFLPKNCCMSGDHYENTPIQIYRKFHLQKLKIFR